MSSPWIEYWNGTTTIYTCARHRDAHDFEIAFSLVKLLDDPQSVVLDFGCGEATRAHFVANRCAKLYLMDGASNVRARLAARFAGTPNIDVLGEDWSEQIPPGSLDLVTLNSVAQYIPAETLQHLLGKFRTLLKPGGRIVISDVIPPQLGPVRDAVELLKFAQMESFMPQAVVGLMRTAFSGYTRMRKLTRLSKFSEGDFLKLLRDGGFRAVRLPRNIGHNQRRMTFMAEPHVSGVVVMPMLADAAE